MDQLVGLIDFDTLDPNGNLWSSFVIWKFRKKTKGSEGKKGEKKYQSSLMSALCSKSSLVKFGLHF